MPSARDSDRRKARDAALRTQDQAIAEHLEQARGGQALTVSACRNAGDGDLAFLAVCAPRFRQEAYEDIDSSPMPP